MLLADISLKGRAPAYDLVQRPNAVRQLLCCCNGWLLFPALQPQCRACQPCLQNAHAGAVASMHSIPPECMDTSLGMASALLTGTGLHAKAAESTSRVGFLGLPSSAKGLMLVVPARCMAVSRVAQCAATQV